jgi:glycosyltransferase involved in cell wall biosynthesis
MYENMRGQDSIINDWVEKADVVVVHFWNHPLLFEFLLKARLPSCRLCFWSHVSGLRPPYVFSEKLVEFSDQFVFASPISFKAKEISGLPLYLSHRLSHVWSTAYIDNYFKVEPIQHEGFNIGFIGTLDYSKLHPTFVDFCSKINIPDVKFIMIGGGCDAEKIKQQVKDRGLDDKFVFTGVISDIRPYLSVLDVLGYPLNPNHFGTCEQVLGEAIAAGVIPIVMKNPAEEYILFQSLVKFVCDDEQDYIHTIEMHYRDRHKRAGIINLIQEQVTSLYDSTKMVGEWNVIFDYLMFASRRSRVWTISDERARMSGADIYVESLGEYGEILERGNKEEILELFSTNRQWSSAAKGSPRQYWYAFQDDDQLLWWAKLAEQGE